jgi:uncharacterized protein involved in outer membrane biogenesis
MKKVLGGISILLVIAAITLALYARSVLTGDAVRAAVAAQVSSALGQPVTIGGLGASIYPRVTMDLTDVTIGGPDRVHLSSMHLGTGLRALFSRRIEGAAVRIDGARITLPVPVFSTPGSAAGGSTAGSTPVEIVSIDEIVLRNVELIGGGRTLRGDIELVPQGKGVQIRRLDLTAEGTTINMTGALTSFAPVEGRIDAVAEALDVDRLLAFLADFTAGSAPPVATAAPAAAASSTGVDGRLTFVLRADRATTGGLTLSDLQTTAQVLPGGVTFEPLTFGVFSGRYSGRMQVALGGTPEFDWRGTVEGIDAAALMAFAGSPNTMTGTLAGKIALDGRGLEMEQALRTARGTARIDITDGTIAGLSLVRTVVTAGSGRGGLLTSASTAFGGSGAGGSERFSRLGTTLTIAGGSMTTTDLALSSPDLDLLAGGSVTLESMTTRFDGRVQLSEELSKSAGTDLYRYAQENGRVTLPVGVSGPLGNLSVRVDVSDAAARAIRNRAAEEAAKAIERNLPKELRGLFGKKKKGGG